MSLDQLHSLLIDLHSLERRRALHQPLGQTRQWWHDRCGDDPFLRDWEDAVYTAQRRALIEVALGEPLR